MRSTFSSFIAATVLAGLWLTASAQAQQRTSFSRAFKMPREQLDEAAGFPADGELRDNVQPSDIRSIIQRNEAGIESRSGLLRTAYPVQKKQSSSVSDLEKTILELSIEEATLAEELGNDHPKLKALRHRIEVTEKLLKTVQQLSERDELKKRRMREEDEEPREVERLREKEGDVAERLIRDRREHREREEREHRGSDEEHQMRKVHALHEAAERLSASGLEDEAHHLHRRAEELEEELHHHREGHAEPEHVMHELLENVELLRREVRETHEKLDRILKILHDDDDDDEVNLRGNEDLIRPHRNRPVWWDEKSMQAHENARGGMPLGQMYQFGGITINR